MKKFFRIVLFPLAFVCAFIAIVFMLCAFIFSFIYYLLTGESLMGDEDGGVSILRPHKS